MDNENEIEFLREGYIELIEFIEENVDGDYYSPEELLSKVVEIADTRLKGELVWQTIDYQKQIWD